MFNTIWSSNGDLDKYLDMSPEEKRAELTNWYPEEMVAQLETEQELNDAIQDNMDIYNEAAEDFEYNIAPMIGEQFFEGLILDEGMNLVDPSRLLDFDGYHAELDEDEFGNLSWDVEGRKRFPILGFSDDQEELLRELDELGILDTLHNLYPEHDDEDFADLYYFEDLIPLNWGELENVLKPAKNLNNLGEACEENLEEAKAKNPSALAREFNEIKDLVDEYGGEYFTQMPFTNFDNDPISIEYQYPEFFRIVKSYWKEMELLDDRTKKNYIKDRDPKGEKGISLKDVTLDNPDVLDYMWELEDELASFSPVDFRHDWEVLLRSCEKLVNGKGVQFEKEYKTGYNSVLDDDEILASREEESLHEKADKGSPDVDGPDGHGGYWENGWHYDENGHIYCYQLVDENGDILDSIGDFESAKYELKYNPDAVKIVLVKSKDESFRWFDDVEEVVWEKGIDESLFTEGVAEVRNLVSQYLMDDLFDWGDNLALKIHDAIPGYDPDWCNDDGQSKLADRSMMAEDEYVAAMLDLLFANAPRQESLEEEVVNEARKYEVDNNFVYIGTGDDQSDIGEIWDDGTLELYHPEKFDAKERAKMKRDLKNYDISFLDESLNEDAAGVYLKFNNNVPGPEITISGIDYAPDVYNIDKLSDVGILNHAFKDWYNYFLEDGNLGISKIQLDERNGVAGWPVISITGNEDLLNRFNELYLSGDLGLDEAAQKSINEDVSLGKQNADKFMKYLADHDVGSGYNGESAPELTKGTGEDDFYLVHIFSQADDLEVYFNDDGTIRWHEEVDAGASDSGEDEVIIEDFADWSEMVAWMKNDNWFWSEDWGSDLPEDLNEVFDNLSDDDYVLKVLNSQLPFDLTRNNKNKKVISDGAKRKFIVEQLPNGNYNIDFYSCPVDDWRLITRAKDIDIDTIRSTYPERVCAEIFNFGVDESLNEDTETWPWGDPESKLPKQDSKESESDIDKYL